MKSLSPQEREALLLTGLQQLLSGALTEGKLLRKLRKEILAMNQDDYAALVGISRRTLSDIENDTGSQSITLINSIFKPLGLRLGLLPTSQYLLTQLLESQGAESLGVSGTSNLKGFNRKQPGWFELYKNSRNQFYFSLKADNGEVILRSDMYDSKILAQNSIRKVQANCRSDEHYENKESGDGRFYFNLNTANQQIIGTSQLYLSIADLKHGIEAVKTNGSSKKVVDLL